MLVGDSVDAFSPHTIRLSVGAIFAMKILHFSREEFWELTKKSKRKVFAAALTKNSVPLAGAEIRFDDIIAFGNEARGLSAEDLSKVDVVTHIPMPAEGSSVDSLNLSNAVAIYLYQTSQT